MAAEIVPNEIESLPNEPEIVPNEIESLPNQPEIVPNEIESLPNEPEIARKKAESAPKEKEPENESKQATRDETLETTLNRDDRDASVDAPPEESAQASTKELYESKAQGSTLQEQTLQGIDTQRQLIRQQLIASANSESEEVAARSDVLLVFKLFCRLSMKNEFNTKPGAASDGGASANVRGRCLVLEMILSILTNSGKMLKNDTEFIATARHMLCVSLSRNGVSSNMNLFELSYSIFLVLLRMWRAVLKTELGILLNEVYLHMLEMPMASVRQKLLVLEGLEKIANSPQILVDIFINYDCDMSSDSVYAKMTETLSRVSQGVSKADSRKDRGPNASPAQRAVSDINSSPEGFKPVTGAAYTGSTGGLTCRMGRI